MLRGELLEELLKLLWVEAFDCLHELKSLLMLYLRLLLHVGRALLHSRVDDVLALSLLFLRRNLIDDLLLVLSLLLSHERSLLRGELIFCRRLLRGVMTSTLQGGEEVVQQDTLARLDLSPLALRSLLLSIGRSRLGGTAPARAQGRDVL